MSGITINSYLERTDERVLADDVLDGLITTDEAQQIVAALDEIGETIDAGKMEFSISLEDIHTHIERALIERLGDVGRKLHTGRSRNDQVVTDVKL